MLTSPLVVSAVPLARLAEELRAAEIDGYAIIYLHCAPLGEPETALTLRSTLCPESSLSEELRSPSTNERSSA